VYGVQERRNSTAVGFAAMSLILMTLLATTTIVASIPRANAQGKADPPIGLFGNPNDFRPGPPIPSCAADFDQGPPNDPIKGCRDTPGAPVP